MNCNIHSMRLSSDKYFVVNLFANERVELPCCFFKVCFLRT